MPRRYTLRGQSFLLPCKNSRQQTDRKGEAIGRKSWRTNNLRCHSQGPCRTGEQQGSRWEQACCGVGGWLTC